MTLSVYDECISYLFSCLTDAMSLRCTHLKNRSIAEYFLLMRFSSPMHSM